MRGPVIGAKRFKFKFLPINAQSKDTNFSGDIYISRKLRSWKQFTQTFLYCVLDAVDERTETSKPEKEIDQSSKAQEIAMTLADPPSSQTSTLATGTLNLLFNHPPSDFLICAWTKNIAALQFHSLVHLSFGT